MTDIINNEKRVLQHLQKNGSITSYEAFEMYGITRLSAAIFNLRRSGHNIPARYKTVKTRYGRHATIAVYTLIENRG